MAPLVPLLQLTGSPSVPLIQPGDPPTGSAVSDTFTPSWTQSFGLLSFTANSERSGTTSLPLLIEQGSGYPTGSAVSGGSRVDLRSWTVPANNLKLVIPTPAVRTRSARASAGRIHQHSTANSGMLVKLYRSYVELWKGPRTRQSMIDSVEPPATLSDRTTPKV